MMDVPFWYHEMKLSRPALPSEFFYPRQKADTGGGMVAVYIHTVERNSSWMHIPSESSGFLVSDPFY